MMLVKDFCSFQTKVMNIFPRSCECELYLIKLRKAQIPIQYILKTFIGMYFYMYMYVCIIMQFGVEKDFCSFQTKVMNIFRRSCECELYLIKLRKAQIPIQYILKTFIGMYFYMYMYVCIIMQFGVEKQQKVEVKTIANVWKQGLQEMILTQEITRLAGR